MITAGTTNPVRAAEAATTPATAAAGTTTEPVDQSAAEAYHPSDMLVDASWPPREPDPDRRPIRWPRYRWPLLMVLFLVGFEVAPPLVAYICIVAALYCAIESLLLLVPNSGGLRDYRQ
jgi:hypothetical protein